MKKSVAFLSACTVLFLLGTMSISGQKGVLLPQNQQLPEILRAPYKYDPVTGIEGVNPDEVNGRDTIHGAKDVNRAFGAGESSAVRGTNMAWPNGNAFLNSSIKIGSEY